MNTKSNLFLFLLVVPFILSACIPRITGDQSEGTQDYVLGKVVANFPQVPFYKGAEVVESYGYKGTFGATFVTGDDLPKVVDFYNQSFPKTGWATNVKVEQTRYVFEVRNEKYHGEVIVNTAADNKKTAITMAFSEK